MKRSIITALAATLVLGTTMAADAVRQHRLAEDAQEIEQAWTAWALGGSSNALLAEDFCGEIVEGKFFLTVPLGSGATELDCTISSGMQAVASPFGRCSPVRSLPTRAGPSGRTCPSTISPQKSSARRAFELPPSAQAVQACSISWASSANRCWRTASARPSSCPAQEREGARGDDGSFHLPLPLLASTAGDSAGVRLSVVGTIARIERGPQPRHPARSALVLLEVDQEFGELGDDHSALNHKPSIRVGMAAVSDRRHRSGPKGSWRTTRAWIACPLVWPGF